MRVCCSVLRCVAVMKRDFSNRVECSYRWDMFTDTCYRKSLTSYIWLTIRSHESCRERLSEFCKVLIWTWHIDMSHSTCLIHMRTSQDTESLQCVAVCCSVLQCVAVCCSVLRTPQSLSRQCTESLSRRRYGSLVAYRKRRAVSCEVLNTLQHTATHCRRRYGSHRYGSRVTYREPYLRRLTLSFD